MQSGIWVQRKHALNIHVTFPFFDSVYKTTLNILASFLSIFWGSLKLGTEVARILSESL